MLLLKEHRALQSAFVKTLILQQEPLSYHMQWGGRRVGKNGESKKRFHMHLEGATQLPLLI